MTNPLLQDFKTPFGTAPFQVIKPKDFKPAIQKAIEIAKNEISDIVENSEAPTFENTLEALDSDYSGDPVY